MTNPLDPIKKVIKNEVSPIIDDPLDETSRFFGGALDQAEDAIEWVTDIPIIERIDSFVNQLFSFWLSSSSGATGRPNKSQHKIHKSREALEATIESEREQKRKRKRWLRLRDAYRASFDAMLRRKEASQPGRLAESAYDHSRDEGAAVHVEGVGHAPDTVAAPLADVKTPPQREIELFALPKHLQEEEKSLKNTLPQEPAFDTHHSHEAKEDRQDLETQKNIADLPKKTEGLTETYNIAHERLMAHHFTVHEGLDHDDIHITMTFLRLEHQLRQLRPPRKASEPKIPENVENEKKGIPWRRWRVQWLKIDHETSTRLNSEAAEAA